MASTIQLERTIQRSQQFIRLSPLTFAANTANDPAFSNADWVKQEILAPPNTYRWNRTGATPTNPTFTTVIGQTDYPVSLSNFGFIEKAVAYDPNNAFASYELQNGLIYGADTLPNQPARIAAQYDNDAGQVTFRIFPAPDAVYNIVVEWQASASLFTSTTNTWTPIPDYLSYIYNTGFDAKSYEYMSDPRYSGTMQLFYTQIANVAEGLSATERNIWLADKLASVREMAAAQQGRR